MFLINNLLKPNSVEEAYKLLKDNKKARILGGGAFLRLSNDLSVNKAIDLYDLNLDYIKENETEFIIGAMTTIRDLETNIGLNKYFDNLFSDSLKNIVGVQLRNIATIGGTIYPKYGFSDLITALLVLDTRLIFEGRDDITLEDYLLEEKSSDCILKSIIIKKQKIKSSFQMLRNSTSDFAILNVAVSKIDNMYKIAVGAKPSKATLIRTSSISDIDDLASRFIFGSNRIASSEYRRDMVKVLIKRALMEVK